MLRKITRDRFVAVLKKHPLTEHSFEISCPKDELIRVSYLHNKAFFYVLKEANGTLWTFRTPGSELLTQERLATANISLALDYLEQWLKFVSAEDDLVLNDATDAEQLKELFFKSLGRHVADENVPFTPDEAEELKSKISRLEVLVESMMVEQKKSAEEVESLKREFTKARDETGLMTKHRWLRAGGGKILNALLSLVKSPEMRKVIADELHKMLH